MSVQLHNRAQSLIKPNRSHITHNKTYIYTITNVMHIKVYSQKRLYWILNLNCLPKLIVKSPNSTLVYKKQSITAQSWHYAMYLTNHSIYPIYNQYINYLESSSIDLRKLFRFRNGS